MGGLKDFFKSKEADGVKGKSDLGIETAYAIQYTDRTPWSDFSVLEMLNPARLAGVLRQVRLGECPRDYLELASDMELKDLHYRSVISTRKDAVCGLAVKVVAGGEGDREKEVAAALQVDVVDNTSLCGSLRKLIRNMLDGNAKGFSVNEILWDTTGGRWKPSAYKWRDPRWFQYDKETGTVLMLRHEFNVDLLPLAVNKFVVYEPHLISGPQIVSGLAFPALFIFMLKNYNVSSWAAFIDRYGCPIRLGKYGSKATKEDILTLKRAVASIGSDFGAVVPESAIIEIIEAKCNGTTAQVYEKMAVWADKQMSKLVLGQTMTTDEGSSRAQSQTHAEVRDDIASSDIVQVMDSLNAQLVVPYVRFNFGDQVVYPRIVLYKPDVKNIEQVINAVDRLGKIGFVVKADEIRNLLGLSTPAKGDEVIGGVGG